ncbi:hypothetical protein POREN0001_1290 [Porphyromonas endodontalis ATCC 35406]|uniref:Uncharacterized protein n=1 Tax=Porphyromonas endodontalis (strain ATCC 35406 / DSM 24491 / JCM 8526 / CCUG 16442 / BCRC 14492 / NCTC 13058 / HG 370) TaxID=553175 RepID=C3J846_POREA|nr:hypothetical protein POREN0001_1290 [Porphyromonas endodontalis ATCC 35406]
MRVKKNAPNRWIGSIFVWRGWLERGRYLDSLSLRMYSR